MSEESPHSTNGASSKTWFSKVLQILGGEPKNREDLVELINEAESNDVIDPGTREMIEGVMEVNKMRVRDIMIPRSQMVTIDIDESVEQFLPIMLESAHSRFPVVNEDKDHIEGILLAKDLLHFTFSSDKEFQLKDLIREAIIVPESKRVDILLKEFRQQRYHMAIVMDEYGGVSGLVTIEDILELIVGEIEDEFDAEENESGNIKQLNGYTYSVKALTELEDFNQFFATEFDEEDADTIGGIVLRAFGHLPEKDESIKISGLNFVVTNADNRRLIQLKVTKPKDVEEKTD